MNAFAVRLRTEKFGAGGKRLTCFSKKQAALLAEKSALEQFKPVAKKSCRGTISADYESDKLGSTPLHFSASRGRRSGGSL